MSPLMRGIKFWNIALKFGIILIPDILRNFPFYALKLEINKINHRCLTVKTKDDDS